MKRKTLLLLVLIGLLLIQAPIFAADPPIPSPDSRFYVLDKAGVLNADTEQLIVETSAALAQKTKAQVVVVTTNSLGGYSPEEYGLAILRQWGIGDKELNNGVLVLVSPTERVSRIEVGYGLEGALPDGKTGRIQDQYMIPYFQNNDFNTGIYNGYLALVNEVANEYKVLLEVAEPQSMPAVDPREGIPMPGWMKVLIIVGIILLLYVDNRFLGGFFTGMLIGMLLRGGGRRGGGGGGGFGGFGGGGGGGGSTRRW